MLPIRKSLFNDDLSSSVSEMHFGSLASMMKTDIKEVDGHFEMEVELPGFSKENINISLEDGYLTIEGSKDVNKENNEKGYVRKERFSGRIARSYYVGDISEEDVKASYTDGVLKVVYSKPKEAVPEVKKIPIE